MIICNKGSDLRKCNTVNTINTLIFIFIVLGYKKTSIIKVIFIYLHLEPIFEFEFSFTHMCYFYLRDNTPISIYKYSLCYLDCVTVFI